MDDNFDPNEQAKQSNIDEQMTGMQVDPEPSDSGENEAQGSANKDDPYGVKKRLAIQAKKHEREMRAMREEVMQMRMAQSTPTFQNADVHHQNAFPSPGQPNGPSGSEEERIQRAVRYALEAKDAEARKAKEMESQAHVQKNYHRLNSEFDKASDRYDDFDDVVRGEDAPFTPALRDALLFIDNPADVAYKLGKNREELQRIAKLHPLDQAREVNKLSFALMSGQPNKQAASSSGNPIGTIKPNPVGSTSVTDKTPASSIRARMKAGTWK